jgi:hypothetical protein
MKTTTHIIRSVIAIAFLFDVCAPAQTPGLDLGSTLPLQSLRDPSRVYFDEPGDGSIHARGNSYTGAFDAGGATFTPLFGAEAPRDYPMTFHLDTASIGADAIDVASSASPARDGARISFERGAITELYELTPAGMEQEFVIARPIGHGDLSLRIRVDTDLAVRDSGDGLEFANDIGAVRYSRAEVVDARGTRVAAATTWAAGVVDIHVDGAFLEQAEFPVTVDPLIYSFQITNASTDEFAPDVAFDYQSQRFLVAYLERLSATSYHVWASEFNSNGSPVAGSLELIASSSLQQGFVSATSRVHVANNAAAHQFLIVWSQSQGSPLTTSTRIFARPYAASTFALGPAFAVSADDGVTRINPDVGGDTLYPGTSNYLVVWEKADSAAAHAIEAQLVSQSGTLVGAPFTVSIPGYVNSVPSISKSDGQPPIASMAWTIVWQLQFSATDHDIYAAQVGRAGNVIQPAFAIDAGTANDTNPAVSSLVGGQGTAPREYLVTFERDMGGRHDIFGALRQGIAVVNEQDLTTLEQGTTAEDNTLSSVDTDGASFAVLCSQAFGAAHNVYFARFTPVGAHLEVQGEYEIAPLDGSESFRSRISSTYSGGGSDYRFFAVRESRASSTANHVVWGLVNDTSPIAMMCTPGDGVTAPCPCNNPGLGLGWGCDNSAHTGGGTLLATGFAMVGVNDTIGLHAAHMMPSALCTFWQGDGVSELGIVFGSGQRCFAGHLIRLGTKSASAGTADYPAGSDLSISARCAALGSPIVDGTTRWYQTSYRDASSPCGAPATFNATAGIQIFWQ